MIVDPVEMLMKTSSLLVPTSTPSHSSHHPLPTIVPDSPDYQYVHDEGKRTLWYVQQITLTSHHDNH